MARLPTKRPSRPSGRTNNGATAPKASLAVASKKRRSRSAKAIAKAAQDVYDYQPVKNRRGNIPLMLDDDEYRGAGYDDEDEEEEEESGSRRRPRLIGEEEDDERIGSDEDEEIDSDAAFDESDEDAFAGSNFKEKKSIKSKKQARRKAGKRVRFAEVDLDEDDSGVKDGISPRNTDDESGEEEEEGEDDEFVDVLDILDGRAKPYLEDEDETPEPNKDQPRPPHGDPDVVGKDIEVESEEEDDDEAEEGEEGEESADDDALISASDEEEEDATALDALDNFVSGLETGTKRKASDEGEEAKDNETSAVAKKRKRLLKDRTESGIENEFNASATGTSKLSLDDLLTPLASKQGALATLKKSVKPLTDSSKNQPLPAPLPMRTQEKLEREAAYEQTKQEVDKWSETMKRIQEAEHLSFPLQTPRGTKVSNLELTAKFKPTTEMESTIDRLLKSAKLREEDINKTEDLMMKDLSVEEVAARRAELRKMRELAFRTDAKAKRIAKIKSKTYRRIHKKERAKLMAKLDATGGQADVDEEEERLRAETERARERATLRHKNTGKWAKAMKARGELDADQRKDINEMLERGERLRRRIQGVESGEEDDSETSGSDEDAEDEDGVIRLKANAFEEIRKIREEDDEDENGDGKQKAKSVFQMKFMKDAAARRNAQLDREIDDFRRELGDMPEESDKDDEENDTAVPNPTGRVHGRMVFRPGPQTQPSLMLPPPPASAISETSTLRSHDSITHSPVLAIHDDSASTPPPSASTVAPTIASEPSNPWLAEATASVKVSRRKNEVIVGKNVSRAQKSEASMQKQLKKGTEERETGRDDALIEIATDNVLELDSAKKSGDTVTPAVNGTSQEQKKKKDKREKERKGKGKGMAERQEEDDGSDTNSEVEEQEAALKKGKKVTAFEQRELVARAFAGDNVVRQFADEKRKEIEADAPHEVDTTLQGWGSWGGAGIKKTAPKPHLIKKVAGMDPKSRADYGKAHVIISERHDKKAMKFAVKDLPYPYTSKAQFEARMSTPLGVEWNTRVGFQRATLPRVVKKMGTVIDPLEKL